MTDTEKAYKLLRIAYLIKVAWQNGFDSYETMPTNEVWEKSATKKQYDKLTKEAEDILFYS